MFHQISFPITYNSNQITKTQFLIAVEKLMQKFSINQDRAVEITEDIIKAIVCENKPSGVLEYEIDGLVYHGWNFLREESLSDVIEKYKKKWPEK